MKELIKRTSEVTGNDLEFMVFQFNFKPNNNRLGFRVSGNIAEGKKVAKELFDVLEEVDRVRKLPEMQGFLKDMKEVVKQCYDPQGKFNKDMFDMLKSEVDKDYPEQAKVQDELYERLEALRMAKYSISVLTLEPEWVRNLPVSAVGALAWMFPEEVDFSDLPKGLDLKTIEAVKRFSVIVEQEDSGNLDEQEDKPPLKISKNESRKQHTPKK